MGTLAANYARQYENARTKAGRDAVVARIRKAMKDQRVNADNKMFLAYIVNYHARRTKGMGGHRPTVHTMMWKSTRNNRKKRHTM